MTVTSLDIVANRASDPLKDINDAKTTLTVDCTKASNTRCKISTFDAGDFTNAQVKAGLYISGYVKATYSDSTVAFSHLTIQLMRKLLIHHLNSCFSLRWCLR